MMRYRIILFALLLWALFAGPALAVKIEISAPGEQTIPLAITALLPIGAAQPGIADEFQQVLASDLDFSGLFELVDPQSFLDDAQKLTLHSTEVDFAQWRVLGS